jgi:hypothetical protein
MGERAVSRTTPFVALALVACLVGGVHAVEPAPEAPAATDAKTVAPSFADAVAIRDRLHLGLGLGANDGDFTTRMQLWWDVLKFVGLEIEWINVVDPNDHGCNFSLSPKFPLGNFAMFVKFGAILWATDSRYFDAGDSDFSAGAGMTYQFPGTAFGVRAEYTTADVGDHFRLATLGGFIRW